jgi:hypothetical protein
MTTPQSCGHQKKKEKPQTNEKKVTQRKTVIHTDGSRPGARQQIP